MNLNKTYIVQYTQCPTNYNSPQYMECSLHGLIDMVGLGASQLRVQFTDKAKRAGYAGPNGVVIDAIYVETETEKQFLYKDGGYGPNHISEALKGMLKTEKKEVLL